MPTTSASLLTPGQTTALLGPPSVPRSNGQLTIHNTACAFGIAGQIGYARRQAEIVHSVVGADAASERHAQVENAVLGVVLDEQA